jgi:hypothetical protein
MAFKRGTSGNPAGPELAMTDDPDFDPAANTSLALVQGGARIDWSIVRAEYETGSSQSDLARRHGVSRRAVQKHIDAGGWFAQDCEPAIARLAAEKLARLAEPGDPEKRAQAVDAEATRRAGVVQRHRDEWDAHKALVDDAIAAKDIDAARLAKVTSETLNIRQVAERRAWSVDAPMPAVQVTLTHRAGQMATIEEIRLAIDSADGRV